LQIAKHGAAGDADLAGDGALAHALLSERDYPLVSRQPLGSALLLLALDPGLGLRRRNSAERWKAGALALLLTDQAAGRLQEHLVTMQHPFQRITEVLQQMPAIGHLDSLRQDTERRLGIRTTAISAHDPDVWMPSEPICCRFHRAIGEQVQRAVLLQMSGSRKASLSPGPLRTVRASCPRTRLKQATNVARTAGARVELVVTHQVNQEEVGVGVSSARVTGLNVMLLQLFPLEKGVMANGTDMPLAARHRLHAHRRDLCLGCCSHPPVVPQAGIIR
jgi:hypothetical protein